MVCVPKDAKINWSIPACVISVAVVKRQLFLLVFVVLYDVIQSFGVCLQFNCMVTKDPGTHCFFNWDSMVLDWDS